MSLIIRFLAKTGLRISEFTGIKNKDIIDYDPKNKQVRITGKGKKERFIFIENEFYREIKSIYPDNDKVEFLFYTIRLHRYDRKVLWKQIKNEFWRKAEIKVHPHLLRHFFATHKIHVERQDIKAVSKFLGHSDVAITLNSYVDTALDVNQAKIKI
jgi:integrase/recombinase XerD